MFLPNVFFLLASAFFLLRNTQAGQTPMMGWMPYNSLGCDINEDVATHVLDDFVKMGFVKAGYKHYSVDCGWQDYKRDINGGITYVKSQWPNGMKAFSDKVKAKGMRFGLYTDLGVFSCDTRTPLRAGSLDHEKIDAQRLASFGADYVKLDYCYMNEKENSPKYPRTDFLLHYGKMRDALVAANINDILICQWGVPYKNPQGVLEGPAEWAAPFGQQYRLADDIAPGWVNIYRIMNQAIHISARGLSGPGHFADADMLEVGNPGMTIHEQRSHFAFWALIKSPLFVSTDLKKITQETIDILQNPQLISANQDSLGEPIKLLKRFTDSSDVFMGPLSDGSRVVLIVETGNRINNLDFDFEILHIASADAMDMWNKEVRRGVKSWKTLLHSHGNVALKLSNIVWSNRKTIPAAYEVQSGSVKGGAVIRDCKLCSEGKAVGNIQGAATITLSKIKATFPTSNLLFDYINAEVQYLGSSNPNVRGATFRVNGGPPQIITFSLSGYDWNDPLKAFKADLYGFRNGADNVIEISAAPTISHFAPDFDRIVVEN